MQKRQPAFTKNGAHVNGTAHPVLTSLHSVPAPVEAATGADAPPTGALPPAPALPVAALARHIEDWLYDCQFRQHSPRTIGFRRHFGDKLLWLLHRDGCTRCGVTLSHTTDRFYFATRPNLIDLGLRLSDAEEMGLQSEPFDYDSKVSPRDNLKECGATKAECDFLVRQGGRYQRWSGQRVELNAMDSWIQRSSLHGLNKS